MCLAVPGRIVERKGETGMIDFGEGTTREVNLSLVDAEVGDYVLVHAGFAIQVLDPGEAKKTLNAWKKLLEEG